MTAPLASPCPTAFTSAASVSQHPVVQHNLAILRDVATPPEAFRTAMRRVATVLMTDATQHLPTAPQSVQTPITTTTVQQLCPQTPLVIVPILRAGLSFADVALDVLPMAHVFHLGLYRDETTLQPVTYYNKLPASFPYGQAQVFLLDPMLATGGSAIAAIEVLLGLGVPEAAITFVCLLASPEGVALVAQRFPQVRLVTAAVDDCLNDKGYIVPGLGDAGDRTFATAG